MSPKKAPALGEPQNRSKLFGEEKIFAHTGIRAPERPVRSIWDILTKPPRLFWSGPYTDSHLYPFWLHLYLKYDALFCRLRKNMSVGNGANSNKVWLLSGGRGQAVVDKYHNSSSKSKRRKRYRCQWLKVPYPVPEDCVCSC